MLRSPDQFTITRRQALQATLATMFAGAMPAIGWAADGRYGGTLVVGLGQEPRILNVNIATDIYIKVVTSNMYNKLANINSDLTLRPELAKSWTTSADGKSYTFTLNDGISWHDGKPMTSEDVKFTFEQMLFVHHNVGATMKAFFEKIETPDPKTVVFTLVKPLDIALTFIAQQGYIFPKHIYEGTDIVNNPANLKPVGTGPFKFVSWTRGREMVMERNEKYFDKSKPYLDKIIIRFIPDASARVIALETGEVDYLAYNDLPASSIEKLRTNKAITVTNKGHEAWGSIVQMIMNLDKPPFNNVKARQAIYHAIDRQFIVDKACFGLTKVATGPISSEHAWTYNPNTKQYPYDPALANKLMDEAGFPKNANGIRFTAAIQIYRSNDVFIRAGQIISEQLKAIGGDVQVKALDAAAVNDSVYIKRDFDIHIQSFVTGPDPFFGVQRSYLSSNIRPSPLTNGAGYRNAKVDELFAKAADSGSRSERAAIYKEISAILAEEVAIIWLYENTAYSAFRSEFAGLHSWAAESIYNYADAFMLSGKAQRG